MRTSARRAAQLPAAIALALATLGATMFAAASEPDVLVDGDAITHDDIERRAHYLALSLNVTNEAKEKFQELIASSDLEEKMKAVQREVIEANPGKSREQLIEILKERQKEIGATLQKRAVDNARAAIMPKLKKDARDELIDERLKLQTAKKHGIEISDEQVRSMLDTIARRNSMSYEQFAQHLKGMGVDIATMVEKLRAQKAWRDVQKHQGK